MKTCDYPVHVWSPCTAHLKVPVNLEFGDDVRKRGMVVMSPMTAAICWHLWRERNNRIFNNIFHSHTSCVQWIINNIILRTSLLSDEERIQFSDGSLPDPNAALDSLRGEDQRDGEWRRLGNRTAQEARWRLHGSRILYTVCCPEGNMIAFTFAFVCM